jgi:hypothetical protein
VGVGEGGDFHLHVILLGLKTKTDQGTIPDLNARWLNDGPFFRFVTMVFRPDHDVRMAKADEHFCPSTFQPEHRSVVPPLVFGKRKADVVDF